MKFNFSFLAVSIFLVLISISCSDDNSDNQMARLKFEFDFNVNGDALEPGKVYQINNTAVSFSVANFYVGGLKLTLENGDIIDLSQNYLLAGIGNSFSVSGEFSPGNITNVEFFIGVDPETNSQSEIDFTSRSSSDPLAIKDPSMHWNWNTGYKFFRIDGQSDTDSDGVVDTPNAYHIGSDPFLKNFDDATNIDLKGGDNTIYFSLDLDKFFEGVDLSTELDTHTGNNLPLTQRLFDNMDTAISIQ